jgi:hypothetical protein
MKYSEEDLQDYLDGCYTGDEAALKNFIEANADWKVKLNEYKALYELVGKAETRMTLPGFAEKMVAIIQEKKEKKYKAKERILVGCFVLIVLAGTTWSIGLLGFHFVLNIDLFLAFITTAVLVTFFIFSHTIELKKIKRKYSI